MLTKTIVPYTVAYRRHHAFKVGFHSYSLDSVFAVTPFFEPGRHFSNVVAQGSFDGNPKKYSLCISSNAVVK